MNRGDIVNAGFGVEWRTLLRKRGIGAFRVEHTCKKKSDGRIQGGVHC
jgi:hypothetical protein